MKTHQKYQLAAYNSLESKSLTLCGREFIKVTFASIDLDECRRQPCKYQSILHSRMSHLNIRRLSPYQYDNSAPLGLLLKQLLRGEKAKQEVFGCMESYYNKKRMHSSIDYKTLYEMEFA